METVEANIDHSVDGAAAAIEALLSGHGTGEAAATETPATQAEEIQPQTAADPAPADEANTSEAVQAPASEVPAPVAAEQPKAQPVSSPELDARLSEADKTTREATAARDQLLNALNVLVPQLETAVKGQFADIKTQDDLLALGDPASPNYNVDRYNAAVIAFTKLNNAQQAKARIQQEAERTKQAEIQANRQVEIKKLVEAIPELGNPQTGPALEAKLRAFAQSKGIAPERIANWGATEVLLLHEAMKAAAVPEALAVAQKKAAKAPPVQQPGTMRETNKNDKVQEDFSRLQKTGRLDDAASVMRNFL